MNKKFVGVISLAFLSLLLSGCLEQEITMNIDKHGNMENTYVASLDKLEVVGKLIDETLNGKEREERESKLLESTKVIKDFKLFDNKLLLNSKLSDEEYVRYIFKEKTKVTNNDGGYLVQLALDKLITTYLEAEDDEDIPILKPDDFVYKAPPVEYDAKESSLYNLEVYENDNMVSMFVNHLDESVQKVTINLPVEPEFVSGCSIDGKTATWEVGGDTTSVDGRFVIVFKNPGINIQQQRDRDEVRRMISTIKVPTDEERDLMKKYREYLKDEDGKINEEVKRITTQDFKESSEILSQAGDYIEDKANKEKIRDKAYTAIVLPKEPWGEFRTKDILMENPSSASPTTDALSDITKYSIENGIENEIRLNILADEGRIKLPEELEKARKVYNKYIVPKANELLMEKEVKFGPKRYKSTVKMYMNINRQGELLTKRGKKESYKLLPKQIRIDIEDKKNTKLKEHEFFIFNSEGKMLTKFNKSNPKFNGRATYVYDLERKERIRDIFPIEGEVVLVGKDTIDENISKSDKLSNEMDIIRKKAAPIKKYDETKPSWTDYTLYIAAGAVVVIIGAFLAIYLLNKRTIERDEEDE